MATRNARRRLAVAGLSAVLLTLGAVPRADGARPAAPAPDGLPVKVRAALAADAAAPAVERVERARQLPGYHHLGATSAGDWAGVMGRVTVRDAAVRRGTFDFVATRLMAKREVGGRMAWLEVGWAETGWGGDGRQRIYTFDTARMAWTFYDRYAVSDGDQLWLAVHTDTSGPTPAWQAWLWWQGEWELLVSRELPLGPRARVEQYVEVFVDPRAGGDGFTVPPVALDGVRVKPSAREEPRLWDTGVPTAPGRARGRYCLDWQVPYHAWRAGDCGPPGA